jgi:mRNA interferase HigB
VRIISRATLKKFYENPTYRDSKDACESWYHEAKKARWSSWMEIKDKYRSISILKNNRIVFNICGNNYRLVVKINYGAQVVFIRFIGTHKEYDKINAEEI